MKIAIPTDENQLNTQVCPSLARAPYFLIQNTQTNELSFVANTAADSQSGAGIKAAQLLVDLKVDVVLAPRCGQNAAEVFQAAKIEIYKIKHPAAQENLEAYHRSELMPMEEFHGGFHGHRGH